MGSREPVGDRDVEPSFDLLAELTTRLSSTADLDEIVEPVAQQIARLGFDMVWMATFEETTGKLITVKELNDGVDTTRGSPEVILDMRRPIGQGFSLRRMINIQDPESLFIVDGDGDDVPPGVMTLPRPMYEHLRCGPFGCGPLLGSLGQPVGALGLGGYRGRQPIPDEAFERGMLRFLMNHLGIAAERQRYISTLARMSSEMAKMQEAIHRDASLKAVGELAAAVAHDLNHLLGVSLLAVTAGLRSARAPTEVLVPIERATRSMGDLIGRLQRVARAGAGAGDGDGTARADEVVQDILVMLAPVFREHSINAELCADAVPAVRADPALLHQVVLNLVLNARDALESMPEHRRSLRVHLRNEDGAVSIAVADSGPGLPPGFESRSFQPFVTTKGDGHMGLGLAASRAALERLGGTLTARNGADGGAVFRVTLQPAPHRRGATEPPEPTPRRTDPTGAAILVIDDDPTLVDLVGSYLGPLGYRVTGATTSGRAHVLAARGAFDLILCDVGLPQRSGLDLCRGLRRAGYRGPIALMTGWDRDDIESRQSTPDHDQLLRKPFSGTDLLRVVEQALCR